MRPLPLFMGLMTHRLRTLLQINSRALLVTVGHRSQVLGHSLALLQVLLCFLGLSPTHSHCHDGLKLWAKANLSSRQLLCREFCTTQKQLLHCLSPVQATRAIFDFCASRACQPGTRVFSSARLFASSFST